MRSFILLILSIACLSTWAQSPYALDWKKEASLLGGSSLIMGVNYLKSNSLSSLSQQDISGLSPQDVNSFDRFATENWSTSAILRSDIAIYSCAGISASSVLLHSLNNRDNFRNEFVTLSVLWLETNMLTYALTDLTKLLVTRTRPYVYNANAPLSKKLELDARKSFFSGHTSLSSANTFFAAKVFSDYYPSSKWKPWVWTAAALLPAWTATERVLAGKHFPTDVMVGYLIGAACGYLVPQLHKKKASNNELSLFPVGANNFTGLHFSFRF